MKGIKFDEGKLRWSLLPWREIKQVVEILTFGAIKYTKSYNMSFDDILKQITGELEKCDYVRTVIIKKYLVEDFVKLATTDGLKNETLNTIFGKKKIQKVGTKKIKNGLKTIDIEDTQTQFLGQETGQPKKEGIYPEEDSQNLQVHYFLKNKEINVQSVGEFSQHAQYILTTTIQQEKREDIYVVGATTDWECLETTFQVLKKQFNILKTSQLKELPTNEHVNRAVIEVNGENNWQYVSDQKNRYYDAAQRHLTAWFIGERIDPESGRNHLAHALCCLLFLLWKDDQDENHK